MAPSLGSSPSQLQRYYPILFTGAALCLAYISYQLYQNNSDSKRRNSLHRSNATRRSRRNRQQTSQQQAAAGGASNESTTPLLNGTTPHAGSENDTPQVNGNASGLPFNDGDSSDDEFAGMDTNLSGGGSALSAEDKQNQNLLNLLYHIAEDSAKREGYVHRGVTCNSCAANPIRGIRYRCANCVDFDLCEHCEALESHPKTHLFFKVRIPAPFLGNSRPSFPPYYPGKPTIMAPNVEPEVMRKLSQETSFDNQEIEALYEQFKCIAATEFPNDPLRLGGAISRPTFDKCFIPNNSQRPAAPNLIYDRLFHFYDTNGDGLIDFSEFLTGLAALQSKNKPERLRRVFRGYDLDDDGWVSREDFLRVFKAFYALSKELVKDIVASLEDDLLDPSSISSLLQTSQPISSVFAGTIPPGESRAPKGSSAHFDDEMYPVTLPSGSDTIEPGEALQRSHHRRMVRRDVGIVGLSEPNVMPTAVFQNPEIRPLAENPQTLQEWLMEPNIHRPRSPPASTTGATRGHLTEIGDDNGSVISRPGSLVSQAITMPHVEGTIGSSHSEGRPPVDFISEPRAPEELDTRGGFQQ
ncbi:EF-hand [Ascobolus immersus RN42]|uniref:EF-hand n=1 Tax=Ascobolus immersus RN42 TaxID=1160509 RepID=A0A3N4HPN0_ASCIM|nr:EF-hand [Ascobolus immersus RN42]